jgi:hypothetical protein
MRLKYLYSVMAAALVAACSDQGPLGPPASDRVELTEVRLAAANPLAAELMLGAVNADSVRVSYRAAGAATTRTVWLRVTRTGGNGGSAGDDGGRALLLGLRPDTEYEVTVDDGAGAQGLGTARTVRTGPLPAGLRDYDLRLSGQPFRGYLLTAVASPDEGFDYAVAFDSTGTIVWYRGFPEHSGAGVGEVKQQYNGNITAFIGNTWGWQPTFGQFVELDAAGRTIRNWTAPMPFYMDNHELLLTPGAGGNPIGHYLTYDLRRTDLRPIGGLPDVLLAGHQIVRATASGQVQFFWNAWDHLELEDWIDEPGFLKQLPNVDFDHPNSLVLTPDGHYLVSMRHMGQVLKVHYVTGAVIWRLGGRRSDFRIENDPLGFFSGQHAAWILPNGNLLLYDNGNRHDPPQSRVAEYALDMDRMVATLVWEYRPSPIVFTQFVGFVERLASGNTFISWGNVGRLTEVTPSGAVVWEGVLNRRGSPYMDGYRVRPIPSLYRFTTP